MNFREREFSPDIDRFPTHDEVHRYLVEYADAFGKSLFHALRDGAARSLLQHGRKQTIEERLLSQPCALPADLRRCIRFSTIVRRLAHSPPGQLRWTVESESNGVRSTERFSHIVVANGHHSEPSVSNWS
jgi:hypothetical protein